MTQTQHPGAIEVIDAVIAQTLQRGGCPGYGTLMRLRENVEQLIKTNDLIVHFLAELNGSPWFKDNCPDEIDMRQRANALHSSLYALLHEIKTWPAPTARSQYGSHDGQG
ncbi:MAG: hypothetical protein VB141_11950 [Burkholderia gladioli]